MLRLTEANENHQQSPKIIRTSSSLYNVFLLEEQERDEDFEDHKRRDSARRLRRWFACSHDQPHGKLHQIHAHGDPYLPNMDGT